MSSDLSDEERIEQALAWGVRGPGRRDVSDETARVFKILQARQNGQGPTARQLGIALGVSPQCARGRLRTARARGLV